MSNIDTSSVLRWLSKGPRGSGRTAALVEATKEIDGTFVCVDHIQADRVHREHMVSVTVMSRDPSGLSGPFIFDHEVIHRMVHEMHLRHAAELRENDGWISVQEDLPPVQESFDDGGVLHGEVWGWFPYFYKYKARLCNLWTDSNSENERWTVVAGDGTGTANEPPTHWRPKLRAPRSET